MRRWVYIAVTFLILQEFQAFGFADRLLYGAWDGKPGDKFTQMINLLFLAASVSLFVHGMGRVRMMRARGGIALYLTAFLFASAAWSVNPGFSIREAILFTFVMVGAIGTAANVDADAFMGLVARACLGCALLTLAFYAVVPHAVLAEGEDGTVDFIGIFSQKNVLGQAMMVGSLAYLHLIRVGQGRRALNLLAFSILGLVCVLSRSATSCLTIVMICGLEVIFASFRKGGGAKLLGIMALVVGVPVIIAAAAAPDVLLELIGKDPTLTGRTDLWAFVLNMIAERPVLGWGYLAFFSSSNPYAAELNSIVGWTVPQAHNGLLEITLHLGLVGAAIYIFLLAHTVILGVRCLRVGYRSLGISTILISLAIIQVGFAEAILVSPFQAMTPVFFVLGLMCEQALYEVRCEPRQKTVLNSALEPGSVRLS